MSSELENGFEDELREFLEADHVDVGADPLFRERLRRRLWVLLLRQLHDGDSPDSGD